MHCNKSNSEELNIEEQKHSTATAKASCSASGIT